MRLRGKSDVVVPLVGGYRPDELVCFPAGDWCEIVGEDGGVGCFWVLFGEVKGMLC